MKETYAQRKIENKSNAIDVNDDDSEWFGTTIKYYKYGNIMWSFIVYYYYILEKRLKVFLDTLLDLNEAGANFSDEELRDEVVTMMIGVSTTKNS